MNFKVVNNMESIEKSRASAGAYVRVIKVGVALHSSPHGQRVCAVRDVVYKHQRVQNNVIIEYDPQFVSL